MLHIALVVLREDDLLPTASLRLWIVTLSNDGGLRQLQLLVRSMSSAAINTLVQTVILCCLDYCNSLLYAITDGLMSRLQSVQNAAARLVSGARRYDHITLVLQELHWLLVQYRVDFKMPSTLFYLSLSGIAPAYLAANCQLASDEDHHQLRSANSRTCHQTDLQQLGRQMFCCCRSKTVEQSSSSSETN